jgi:hypothetical protein
MKKTLISIRVDAPDLEAMRSEARTLGITVTDVLVNAWRNGRGGASVPAVPKPGGPSFSHGRARTVVVPAKRQRVEAVASHGIVHELEGVQVGPRRPAFGSMLKPTKGKPNAHR